MTLPKRPFLRQQHQQPSTVRRLTWLLATLWAGQLLSGCALQGPQEFALPSVPPTWRHAWQSLQGPHGSQTDPDMQPPAALLPGVAPSMPPTAEVKASPHEWWSVLAVPGLPQLVEAAQQNAPSLAIAMARIEEARANVTLAGAAGEPQVNAGLKSTRGNQQNSSAWLENTHTPALNLSWEIDLFGRLKHNQSAALRRLDASEADARATRLALQTQVVEAVLTWRECRMQVRAVQRELASRQLTESLVQRKRDVGFAAPQEVAKIRTVIGEVRNALVPLQGNCTRMTHSLVALTGASLDQVEQMLQPSLGTLAPHVLGSDGSSANAELDPVLALPSWSQPAVPGHLIAGHPGVQATLQAAQAAYEEVGAARAAQYPSLNLSALLGRAWIRIGSFHDDSKVWEVSSLLGIPWLDGGRSDAVLQVAQARLKAALAMLDQKVRDVVLDVETALAQLHTTEYLERDARLTLNSAQTLFAAQTAAHQVGRISQLDLENTRLQLSSAQIRLMTAQHARARAWVTLVKATANAVDIRTLPGSTTTPAAGPTPASVPPPLAPSSQG